MFQSKRRWPRQPTPVLDTAARLFADLLRESNGKHDDRQVR